MNYLPNDASGSDKSDKLGTFCILLGASSGSSLSKIGGPPSNPYSKKKKQIKNINHKINR